MKFAIETTGRLRSTEGLDRAALEAIYDQVGDALADLHDLEADVALDLDTALMQFFIVVEAPDSREAFKIANDLMDRAMTTAEVSVDWNEAHARRADLIPA